MIEEERIFLTRRNADAYLKPGDEVHTMMEVGDGVLIGAMRSRESILALAQQGFVSVAGPEATRMKHGVVAHTHVGHVFCATG